jgi:hypothetical protein
VILEMETRTTVDRDGLRYCYEGGYLACIHPLGECEGVWRFFHPNGALKAEVLKIDYQAHGIAREWHDNGYLASETHYEHGKIQGISRDWNRNGELERELEYYLDPDPSAIRCKSYSRGRIMNIFLWNGKPRSKTRRLKSLAAAGYPQAELEKRFPPKK